MITALLLIASCACLFFSHGCAMEAHATKQHGWTSGMLILWAIGMAMAYTAGVVL